MPSGYTTALPDDVLLDVAVLSHSPSGTPVTFGVTRGGLRFNPQKEIRNVEFDGKRSPIAGLDRITSHTATMSGTFIQFGTAQIAELEVASAAQTAGTPSTYTITPYDASTLIAEGDLLTDLTMTYSRLGGGSVKIIFPKALCTQYELGGTDNSEAEVQATFEARLESAEAVTSTDTPPYRIEVIEPAA